MVTQLQKSNCMLWFTKPYQWQQCRKSLGCTHLSDHSFMLGTSSLHRVVVSAKARVQCIHLFLKKLWAECDSHSCAIHVSQQDVPAGNLPFPSHWYGKLLGSIGNWSATNFKFCSILNQTVLLNMLHFVLKLWKRSLSKMISCPMLLSVMEPCFVYQELLVWTEGISQIFSLRRRVGCQAQYSLYDSMINSTVN
jgi:hypothetical protein